MKTHIYLFAFLLNYVSGYHRVCYYTNWSQYRPNGGKFTPDDIQAKLCTHIIFAFGKLEGNNIVPFEWNDESTEWSTGMYAKVTNLKKTNRQLRVLLAMGGWNAGSLPFSKMAATSGSRAAFVNSTLHYLRQRDFDGLDMDWEYPAMRGGRPEDKDNLVLLFSELKQAFEQESYHTGKPRLLLTAAVPAGKTNIDAGYDIPNVARNLDFINIMTYDMHGSWEPRTGHNSPLYGRAGESVDDATLNMDWTAKYWAQQGAPKHKLVIGFGLYGRSFQLTSPTDNGLGAPSSGPGAAGKYTREAGFMAYYEVCEKLKNGSTRVWNNEQKIPYFYNGDLWVGYDDEESIKEKVNWLKQNKYGGAMVWSLALDDFSGTFCGKGRYPLLKTVLRELKRKDNASHIAEVSGQHQEPPPGTAFISRLDLPASKQKRSGHSQLRQPMPGGHIIKGAENVLPQLSDLSILETAPNAHHRGGHVLSEVVQPPHSAVPTPVAGIPSTSHDIGHTLGAGAARQGNPVVQLDPVPHHSPNGHALHADHLSRTIPHDTQSIILPPEVTSALLGNLSHADSQFPIIVELPHKPTDHHSPAHGSNIGHNPASLNHGLTNLPSHSSHSEAHVDHGPTNVANHPTRLDHGSLNVVHGASHIDHGTTNVGKAALHNDHGSQLASLHTGHRSINARASPANVHHGSHHSAATIPGDMHHVGHGPRGIIEGNHPQSRRRTAVLPEPVVMFEPMASIDPAGVVMDAAMGPVVLNGNLPAQTPLDILTPPTASLPTGLLIPEVGSEFQILNNHVPSAVPRREINAAAPASVSSSGSGASQIIGALADPNAPDTVIISNLVRAAQRPSSGLNLSFSRSSSSSSNSNSSSSNSSSNNRNIEITPADFPFLSFIDGNESPVIVQEGFMPVVSVNGGFSPGGSRSVISVIDRHGRPQEVSIGTGSRSSVVPVTSADNLAQILQSISTDGSILLPPEETMLSTDDILRELTLPNMVRGIRTSAGIILRQPPQPPQRTIFPQIQRAGPTSMTLPRVNRLHRSQLGHPGSSNVIQQSGRTITHTRPRVVGSNSFTGTRIPQQGALPRTGTQSISGERPLLFQRRQVIQPTGTTTRLQQIPTTQTRFRMPTRTGMFDTQGINQFTPRQLPQQPRRNVGGQQNILVLGSPSGSTRQLSDIQGRINGNIRVIPWS